ncbi:YqiA/YcfP family alpha/beta fold hydrolase [Symbiopectobacterium sp.]|uniref:YqiA/YcfP family alpha/beta fold hydrolase n=1 Tax=Symbiopectobacterium sp. TaxID=2952789 RepID=UPI003F3755EC
MRLLVVIGGDVWRWPYPEDEVQMIIYLHGFDSTSPGNHEKVLQLQFIDQDVELLSWSRIQCVAPQ